MTEISEQAIKAQIQAQLESHPILLYMKGTPQFPQCGFSSKAVQLLNDCGATFTFIDVLANPAIRQWLPTVSGWPTFPQLYINGELIGGSDIMKDEYDSGTLQTRLQHANQAD